jgi:hypothetical protein
MYVLVQILGRWFKAPVRQHHHDMKYLAVLVASDVIYNPQWHSFEKSRTLKEYSSVQLDLMIFAKGGIEKFPTVPKVNDAFDLLNSVKNQIWADENSESFYLEISKQSSS